MFECYRIRFHLAFGDASGGAGGTRLETHALSCPDCRARLAARRRLETAMRATAPGMKSPAPTNLAARVREEIATDARAQARASAGSGGGSGTGVPASVRMFPGMGRASVVAFSAVGLLAVAIAVRWEYARHGAAYDHPEAGFQAGVRQPAPMPSQWLHTAVEEARMTMPKPETLVQLGTNLGTPLEEEWRRVVMDATNTIGSLARSWMPSLADAR